MKAEKVMHNTQTYLGHSLKLLLSVFLISCFFICLTPELHAQNRSQLEEQRKRLQDEIKYTQQLLERTRRTRTQSLEELEALQRQIRNREELIHNINRDINILEQQIEELNDVVTALERDLESIREEYAKLIIYAYRNRSSLSLMMYVFAAENFNSAVRRAQYLREISAFRQKQAKLIQETQRSLTARIERISDARDEKQALLDQQNQQKQELGREKTRQDDLVRNLRGEEQSLQRQIAQKEQEALRLNQAIEEIIRREIEEARRRAERERRQGENVLSMTPETAQLSAEFSSNMGKLPWPVERGVITGTFGTHTHPVLPGVKVNNNGVDIRTEPDARVRALFNGEVTRVIYNPVFQNAVIIRHGEYFTIYSRLKEVFVRAGQSISTRQDIGLVYTDSDNGKTEVHLEIWQGTKILNPALWLFNQ